MRYLVGRKNLSFNKIDYHPGDIIETDEDRDWWVLYGYLTVLSSESEEMSLPESLLMSDEEE